MKAVFDTKVILAAYLTEGLLALHAFEGIPIITPRDFETFFAE